MKTFLKVLLCVVAAVLALKFLPFLLVPVIVAGIAILVVLGLLLGGLVATLGVGFAALVAVTAILLVVLSALSPIWIPVLAVFGLIALLRRNSRAHA